MNQKTAQHTPGPWKVSAGTTIEDIRERRLATVPESSALCGNPHDAFDETRANARLIAAAPELLEACRSALAEIAHCQVTNYAHATLDAAEETLRAAITKATRGN